MADLTTPAASDPLDIVVKQRIAEKQRSAVAINEAIIGNNPDQFASHLQIADQLGVPVDSVQALPDRAKSMIKAKEIADLFPSYKATGEFITNPDNMRLVNDDLESLRQTESAWGDIKAGGKIFAKSIGMIGTQSLQATAQLPADFAQNKIDAFSKVDAGGSSIIQTGGIPGMFQINADKSITLLDDNLTQAGEVLMPGHWLYDYIMDPASRQKARENAERDAVPENHDVYKAGAAATKWLQSTMLTTRAQDEGIIGTVAGGVGSATGYLALAAVNPFLAAGAGAAQGAQSQYEDARAHGADVATARRAAALGGIVGLSELLPAEALIGKFGERVVDRAVGKFLGRVLIGAGTEGAEEVAQQIATNFIAQQLYAPDRSIWDGVGSSGVGGGSGGAFLGALFGLLDGRASHHTARIDAALKAGDIIGASKLFSRAPAKAAEFVQKLAGNDPDAKIFIPGETVKELFQADDGAIAMDLATQWGLTADQVAESIATGADIGVPVAQYMTKIQPSPKGAKLSDIVRVGDFGMSKQEFERYKANRETLMAGLSAQLDDVKATVEPMRQVFDDIYSQLRLAGRSTTEARNIAAIYAARSETRASRRGKGETAWDVHQANGLSIKLVLPETLQALTDGQLSEVIAAAKAKALPADQSVAIIPTSQEGATEAQGGPLPEGAAVAAATAQQAHAAAVDAAARDLTGIVRKLGLDPATASEDDIRATLAGAVEKALVEQGRGFEQDAPAVVLTGEELAPADASLEELRTKAEAYWREHLSATSIDHPTLGKIQFTGTGRKKFFHTTANADKLRLVPALHEIVMAAELARESDVAKGKASKRGIKKFLWLKSRVQLAGRDMLVGITVYEDLQGNKFYNINEIAESPQGGQSNKSGTGGLPGGTGDRSFNQDIVRDADGVNIHVLAASPIQTKTQAFRAWFGDSKVVDAAGEPLVAYHGTGSDFDEFARIDAGNAYGRGFYFTTDPATASNYALGEGVNRMTPEGNAAANVMPVYLRISKPFKAREIVSREDLDRLEAAANKLQPGYFAKGELAKTFDYAYPAKGDNVLQALPPRGHQAMLRDAGFDGLDTPYGLIAFEATQIKSAVGNRGTFDPNDPRILHQSQRGKITFRQSGSFIQLFANADQSTLIHESGHLWLEELIADAAEPDAPQQIKDDLAAVLKWFGVTDPSQIEVDHHEQWARGIEQYFMEGKAPTSSLQRIFNDFKRWLLRIYRTVTALNSPVTDDVRRVMDRLLAVDEEIAAAKADANLRALFTEATADNMSKDEFEAYKQKILDADATTNGKMLGKVMEDLLKRRTAEWKAEETRTRDDVADELDRTPVFAAIRYLRDGTWHDGGKAPEPRLLLDRDALIDMYGMETFQVDGILKMVPAGTYRNEGGVHPDIIAPLFGYASGRDLVDDMIVAESKAKALAESGDPRSLRDKMIADETEARMRAAYGNMLDEDQIREAAEDAIRNGPQEDILAMELRVLARKSKQPPTPLQLAKDWAVEQIAGRQVADVTSLHHYARAEAKAGRAAETALLAGKFDDAFRAKRQQLLNMLLHKEAKRMAEKVGKAVDRLDRYATARTIKGMDQDYLDQIHAVLSRFSFTKLPQSQVAKLISLRDWAAKQEEDGVSVNVPEKLLNEAFRTHYTKMTVGDLIDLKDTADQIAHLGRLKGKLLKAAKDREIQAAADDLISSLLDAVPEHGRLQGSWQDRLLGKLRTFLADHRKLENVAVEFDGGKRGHWWKLIYRPLTVAAEEEATRTRAAGETMKDLFSVYSKAERKVMAEAVTVQQLGRVMTKWDLIALALNMGNQGNVDAIQQGNKYDPDTVMQVLAQRLTKKDWDFVQSIWDYVDTFWPEIAQLERRMTGVTPGKVEGTPVMTPFGMYRGGYYPLKGDGRVSGKKASEDANERYKQMLGGGVSRATTRHGHTKERIGFGQTPVKLDIGVLFGHVAAVIHDLTHREAVVDVHRLFTRLDITDAINQTAGYEARQMIDDTIRAVAGGDPEPNTGFSNFIRYLRGGYIISRLGLNVANALQNFTGLAPAMALVGEKRMVMHAIPFLANPVSMGSKLREIARKSPMMADRLKSSSRDMRDVVNAMDPRKEMKETAKRWAMGLGAYTDLAVSGAAWLSAYNKAMEGEADVAAGNEKEAIEFADSVIRRTMGAGYAKDLATIQRGGEMQKLLTTFLGYFINIFNLNVDQVKGLKRRQINPMRFALNMLWINTIPALLGDMILNGGPPDDDDDRLKAWAKWAATAHIRWIAGGVVGVRDVVSAWMGWAPQTAYAAFLEANKNLALQAWQGEFDRGLVKSAVNLVGPLLSVPSSQIWKTGDGITRLVEGEDLSPWEALVNPPPKK